MSRQLASVPQTGEVAQPAGKEARRALRKAVRAAGQITAPRCTPITCSLLDLSVTGARLKLSVPEPKAFERGVIVPDRFNLLMRFDRVEVDCELVWRKGNEVGVRFLSPPRPIS